MAALQDWIGRSHEVEDVVTPESIASYRAMLGPHLATIEGAAALHWCLAPDIASGDKLGPAGHPARGGFLPPAPCRAACGQEATCA